MHESAVWRSRGPSSEHRSISGCESKREAVDTLRRPPFGFTEMEAEHVLDLPLSTCTRGWRAMIEDEVRQLEALLEGDR